MSKNEKIILDEEGFNFKLEQLSVYKEGNKYSFFVNDNYLFSEFNYEIINPSSDQAFKRLFIGNYRINGINGIERALSLLNSFLDLGNEITIINLHYLFNEIPSILGEKRENLKVTDLPFIATLSNNKKIVINVEMQTNYYKDLNIRMLSYGYALKNLYDYPVIILLLLNRKSPINRSFVIKPCQMICEKSIFIEDNVKVICLDLNYFLRYLNNVNKEANLKKFGMKKEASSWIKLFTINYWSTELETAKPKRYPIPMQLDESKEIISAIKILNEKDDAQLIKAIIVEEENEKYTKEVLYLELWINAFQKKLDINNDIVPFPDIHHKQFLNICLSHLDKDNYIQFVQMLEKKNLVKNIYS